MSQKVSLKKGVSKRESLAGWGGVSKGCLNGWGVSLKKRGVSKYIGVSQKISGKKLEYVVTHRFPNSN